MNIQYQGFIFNGKNNQEACRFFKDESVIVTRCLNDHVTLDRRGSNWDEKSFRTLRDMILSQRSMVDVATTLGRNVGGIVYAINNKILEGNFFIQETEKMKKVNVMEINLTEIAVTLLAEEQGLKFYSVNLDIADVISNNVFMSYEEYQPGDNVLTKSGNGVSINTIHEKLSVEEAIDGTYDDLEFIVGSVDVTAYEQSVANFDETLKAITKGLKQQQRKSQVNQMKQLLGDNFKLPALTQDD